MGNYASIAEVRAEGVPASVADARITLRISKWEAIIERMTGNYFHVLTPGELTFDGSNMSLLHFSVPLIAVSSLKINDETTALSTDDYRVYASITPPKDDRQNPKIELRGSNSIYRRTSTLFMKGYDQKVTATWGWVDPDPVTPGAYITPPAIKAAVIQLVVMDLDGYFDAVGSSSVVTPIMEEKTDGHSIKYQATADIRSVYSLIPQDIYEMIMLYRVPIKIGVPDNRQFVDAFNYQIMAY